jgi:hypothetical protein
MIRVHKSLKTAEKPGRRTSEGQIFEAVYSGKDGYFSDSLAWTRVSAKDGLQFA